MCLSVTLLIAYMWQYCVWCIRSGVIRCTLLMVLYLDLICQCGLHAVLWLHIGILMRRLAADPSSTARVLFPSQCLSGTFLLTPYSMVWDWRVSRAGPMLYHLPKLLYPSYCLLPFFFFFFLSVYLLILWGCGLRTNRVYLTLSQPSTAASFNNNNYYYNYTWFESVEFFWRLASIFGRKFIFRPIGTCCLFRNIFNIVHLYLTTVILICNGFSLQWRLSMRSCECQIGQFSIFAVFYHLVIAD